MKLAICPPLTEIYSPCEASAKCGGRKIRSQNSNARVKCKLSDNAGQRTSPHPPSLGHKEKSFLSICSRQTILALHRGAKVSKCSKIPVRRISFAEMLASNATYTVELEVVHLDISAASSSSVAAASSVVVVLAAPPTDAAFIQRWAHFKQINRSKIKITSQIIYLYRRSRSL